MDNLVESYDRLQEQLASHKQKLRDVDSSIKRLTGNDRNGNRNGNGKIELTTDHNLKARIILTTSTNEPRKISLSTNKDNSRLKRKSYDDQRYSNKNKRNSGNMGHDSPDEDNLDRPTMKSSIVSSTMPIKTKEDLIKIQNKGVNVQRNKRLFGHLLGTLSQFKSDDQVRSSTTQAIHRKELEAKIEINKVEEIKRLSADKKLLEEEKHMQQQAIEILEAKMRLSQDFEDWKKNQLKYKKFIRTKSKPFVFFLPKTLDENTTKLLEETAAMIDDGVAKKLKETEAELEVLKRKEALLNKTDEKEATEKSDNKENKLDETMNSGVVESDNDEMDDEKINANNVQLGDEVEEETVVEASNVETGPAVKVNEPEATCDKTDDVTEEMEVNKDISTSIDTQNTSTEEASINNTSESADAKAE